MHQSRSDAYFVQFSILSDLEMIYFNAFFLPIQSDIRCLVETILHLGRLGYISSRRNYSEDTKYTGGKKEWQL